MLVKVYACLHGNWVCLNDDPDCRIMEQRVQSWWEDGAEAYAPLERDPQYDDSYCGLNYVRINYRGKEYRINPIFIQIVTE